MISSRIKVVYLENYKGPKLKQRPGDSCFDLRAAIGSPYILSPGAGVSIPLGVILEPEDGLAVELRSRSSVGLEDIFLVTGTIDPSYRGEIHAYLFNASKDTFKINPGDRVAQAKVEPVYRVFFDEQSQGNLSETWRGGNGFGHTGRNQELVETGRWEAPVV